MEHIPDPLKGLLEGVRVLKPSGYAITSIPVRLPIPMHLYVPQNPREVLDLYERANLDVLDFSAILWKKSVGFCCFCGKLFLVLFEELHHRRWIGGVEVFECACLFYKHRHLNGVILE